MEFIFVLPKSWVLDCSCTQRHPADAVLAARGCEQELPVGPWAKFSPSQLDPSPGHVQVLSLLLPTHSPCQASSQKPSRSSMPQSWQDSGCHAGEHHVVGRGKPSLVTMCFACAAGWSLCISPVMAEQLPYGKLMCWQVRRMGGEGSLGLWQVLQLPSHKVQPATMMWWVTSPGPFFNVQILHPLLSGIAHVFWGFFFSDESSARVRILPYWEHIK